MQQATYQPGEIQIHVHSKFHHSFIPPALCPHRAHTPAFSIDALYSLPSADSADSADSLAV